MQTHTQTHTYIWGYESFVFIYFIHWKWFEYLAKTFKRGKIKNDIGVAFTLLSQKHNRSVEHGHPAVSCHCRALGTSTKFQLEILIKWMISAIQKFRENILESEMLVKQPSGISVHTRPNLRAPKHTLIVMKYFKCTTFNTYINNRHDSPTFDICTGQQLKWWRSRHGWMIRRFNWVKINGGCSRHRLVHP